MTTADNPNSTAIADFIAASGRTPLPAEVLDSARQCVVDWFAVCLAARTDPEALAVSGFVNGWRSQGRAIGLEGSRGAAGPIALINGTLSHTLDFDDFHIDSLHHATGPTFAAAFSLGLDRGCSGAEILAAFVAGFEVGTQVGLGGIGLRLVQHGWHATSILGHLSAATAGGVLLKLDRAGAERAIGLAALQAGGLMAAAGTIAKPFVVGKAAMNGVSAAELAEKGVLAPTNLLDIEAPGLFATLFQDNTVPRLANLGRLWEITRNTYKPYSACQLTHASFDAAQAAGRQVQGRPVKHVRVIVNPLAPQVASHREPTTPLESRFSINYCVGLGLLGYRAGPADFSEERLAETRLRDLSRTVEVVTDESVERWGSRIEVTCDDDFVAKETVTAALGSLGRAMAWSDLEAKFLMIVEPLAGARAPSLLAAMKAFDQPGALDEIVAFLASLR